MSISLVSHDGTVSDTANYLETRQVLSHKLNYARHDTQEKSKPTDDLFLNFEEAQHTMEEAELVLNTLLIANKDVKQERLLQTS